MPVWRIYADTSVIGGAFDPEFAPHSERLFEYVRAGRVEIILSSLVRDEILPAKAEIRDFFEYLLPLAIPLEVEDEALRLQAAYLERGVVSAKWSLDALHVAVATVAGCNAIVSWNFKHIVNLRKIPMYNAVNIAEGYSAIAIHTPPEVVLDDE